MKRSKQWWKGLTKEERSELVYLERAGSKYGGGGSAYLPEGYSDCQACGTPTTGSLCDFCLHRLIKLTDKADNKRVKQILAAQA